MEKINNKYFEIPKFCLFPIPGEFINPVMLISGHPYERNAIQNSFDRCNTKKLVKFQILRAEKHLYPINRTENN